ncbi:MAG: thioredoxin-dependent thiol peroxidase [Alphaproteobacteria bacterium]|nr:MAG: thioredoxin-dependent thiol peroxidase [Alphaproteobacteria bacterium]TAF16103.1 MAG: thioredoxin-dependent thiol peroxidase [Alphaproteobacteria bacterium]TAF75950.1 MAG: thioredoxin-dependent thiol peroxidase [Alphaproteobacteria bacterium]
MTHLTVSMPAPDFSLPNHAGEIISRSGLQGSYVVLYFYPKDDTPGCTTEALDFTRLHQEFAQAGAVILGISKDSTASHCSFIEKHSLNVMLLSDEEGSMCEAYGVWTEKSMYGKKYMGIERTTLLLDKDGVIRHIWNKVKVTGHAEDVLEKLRTLAQAAHAA